LGEECGGYRSGEVTTASCSRPYIYFPQSTNSRRIPGVSQTPVRRTESQRAAIATSDNNRHRPHNSILRVYNTKEVPGFSLSENFSAPGSSTSSRNQHTALFA